MMLENQWRFHTESVVDPVGRVLSASNRIGRAINKPFADEIRNLVHLAEKRKWFDHGLVNTWIVDDTIDGYGLVLEHERIPYVTYRREWPALALQRAALCTLDLAIALYADGYALKDAHCWNVLFQGTRPKFVDFASIRPIREMNAHAWMREFRNYFLAPLCQFSEGKPDLARALTQEHLSGTGLWILNHEPSRLVSLPSANEYTIAALEALRKSVADLKFSKLGGAWGNYEQPAASNDGLRQKDVQVAQILDRLKFSSAIDIGANRGLHSFMCADRGASVVACDIEEGCLNDIFLEAEARNASVMPTYLDLVNPAGTSGAFASQPSVSERLRCDLVIALAIVHHICFRRRYYVDTFVRSIASFSDEHAIVEFVPDSDFHVAQWRLPPLEGYSTDEFRQTLLKYFRQVEEVPIEPEPRCLFVCSSKI
ncbi:MAG: hypothetical protein QM780_17375 [Hyphomicrobium sp.]|uniref:hypothetical protein n=1 Tax=Hyphomicrobium sp. TaxID=82 RepID=UPI0039E367BC